MPQFLSVAAVVDSLPGTATGKRNPSGQESARRAASAGLDGRWLQPAPLRASPRKGTLRSIG